MDRIESGVEFSLEEIRRWAEGDLSGLHGTARDAITFLAWSIQTLKEGVPFFGDIPMADTVPENGGWGHHNALAYDDRHLEQWSRGDLQDLNVDAVTVIRELADQVLKLSGKEDWDVG